MPNKPPMWQPIIEQQRQEMFIGRKDQLGTFADNFVGEIPKYMIFAVTGEGGVGKSELLRQFTALTTSSGISGVAIISDDRYLSPVAVMGHVAEELAKLGYEHKAFDDQYTRYRRLQKEVESDEKAPRSVVNLLARGVSSFAVKNLRKTPGVGIFFDSVDEKAAGDTLAEFVNYSFSRLTNKDDVALLREPEKVLTPLFLELLAKVSETRRVVLMFDVFEQTCNLLEPWLLSLLKFEYGQFNVYLTFVISGRDPLDQQWTYFAGSLCRMPLEPFTTEETTEYLATRGVTHAELVAQIYEATAGLPVLVELLAGTNPQPGMPLSDVSPKAVDRFLQWIPQPDRRQVALLAAAPRQFNRDILSAALGYDATTHFNWLANQSYVRTVVDRGWFYHEKVRELMLRYLRNATPADLAAAHARLAQFFADEQNKLGLSGRAAYDNETWCRWEVERVYHTVSAQPEQNTLAVVEAFLHALRWRWRQAQPITSVCRQIAHETHISTIDACATTLHDAFVAYDRDDYVVLIEKLTVLEARNDLSPLALRHLYDRRGETYMQIDKYDEALTDLTRAIELDDKDAQALATRGETYQQMGKYEEAIADLTRAIELDDKDTLALATRGFTYLQMGKYEEAIADLTHAIELDDKYAWAFAIRGFTYQLMGKYEGAIADLTRAIELDGKDGWSLASRGETYQWMGKYEESLADLTRAIELDNKDAWVLATRSETYQLMGKYEESLADLTRAIELDNKDAGALARRGFAYQQMGKYEESLADLTRAIGLDDKDVWALATRGETYQLMGKYEEAIADLTRAIGLDDKDALALATRSETYQLMGKYEGAIADLTRAIELDDKDAWALARRGFTYQLLGKYDEALADLTRAIGLDEKDDWSHYLRSLTHLLLGAADQARSDLVIAIERASTRRAENSLDWQNNLNLAIYHLANDQFDLAEGLYREAVDANTPTEVLRDAITDLNNFLALFPDHSHGQALRAMLQTCLDSRQ